MKSLIAALSLGIGILTGCSSPSPTSSETSEEQARLLPRASEVQAIKVIVRDDKKTFDVPPDQIPAIMTLFNSGSKDDHPSKWVVMSYDLEIITKSGKHISVWLFRTHGRKGAFAIGPTWEERQYFRGSTDEKITAAIEKARGASR